ncbi:MAG: FimV/HubP family polar landmark protein, partial [Thiobacillaceae bacterium]
DTVAFEAQASELYASLGGQPTEVWLKAAEMGRSIDPDNPLYRVTPATATPGVAAVAAAATAATAAAATTAMTEPVPEPEPLEFAPGAETAATPPSAGEQPAPGTEAGATLDFDLGPVSEEGAAAQPTLTDLLLPESEASGEAAAAVSSTLASLETPETTTLDFDLEPPPAEQASAPDLSDLTVAEVEELELPEAAPPSAPSAHDEIALETPAAPAETNQVLPEMDLSGIDLELKEDLVPEAPPAVETALTGSGLESPVSAETVTEAPTEIDPEVWEETNTKLDLARAYLEMGDQEGAREILQEVLADGDSRQKDEARKLLAEAA